MFLLHSREVKYVNVLFLFYMLYDTPRKLWLVPTQINDFTNDSASDLSCVHIRLTVLVTAHKKLRA